MSSNVPKDIREQIQRRVWLKADELGWRKRSDIERATWYENWAKEKDIGGVLAHYMDPRKVRVYIKDSLLKPYQRARLGHGLDRVLSALNLQPSAIAFQTIFSKPHGRLLGDGRVICWGNSRDWKIVVFSVFERARRAQSGTPFAAVLLETGKPLDQGTKDMALEAARRLGIGQLIWLD